MSTSKTYDPITDIIFSKGLKIKSAILRDRKLDIILKNDLILVVSLKNYERLNSATLKELSNFKIIGNGTGLGDVAEIEVQMFSFVQQLSIRTAVEISTEPVILPY